MYIVQIGDHLFGPFKTADDAVKWATSQGEGEKNWSVRPIKSPT